MPGLYSREVPWVPYCHFCEAPVPQVEICTGVPLVLAPPLTVRHLPELGLTRRSPSICHFCPALALQV